MEKQQRIATGIALFFHTIGLVGLLVGNRDFFIQSTPLNLLLSLALLIWTTPNKHPGFWLFAIVAIVVGIGVEMIGVNTGYLFGDYKYGKALGPGWKGVPWIIGANWFIVIFCCANVVRMMMDWLEIKVGQSVLLPLPFIRKLALVADAATLAVLFDWLMEPVAIDLGFWTWGGDGSVPAFNYLSWALVSIVLLVFFQLCKIKGTNKFALHLLLIQTMFFLILRTFLN